MDNAMFKLKCEEIDGMNEKELKDYIAELARNINDPFDDQTDLTGDIVMTMCLNRANNRLNEFIREFLKV